MSCQLLITVCISTSRYLPPILLNTPAHYCLALHNRYLPFSAALFIRAPVVFDLTYLLISCLSFHVRPRFVPP